MNSLSRCFQIFVGVISILIGMFFTETFSSKRGLNTVSSKAYASAVPGAWEGLVDIATWARLNFLTVEPILRQAIAEGRLDAGVSSISTSTDGKWTYRLTVNANANLTATAIATTAFFAHKFEIWRAADQEKALEFYFSDPGNLDEANVLSFYRLKILIGDAYTGDDLVTESFTMGSKGARIQTLTFTGGAFDTAGIFERGRVILEEADEGQTIYARAVVQIRADSGFCSDLLSPKYYSLAFVQSRSDDKLVTARFGIKINDIDSAGESCGVANAGNYGLFSEAEGYVAQGVSTIPAGYPAATDVLALYSELGTAGSGVYETTTLAALTGWTVAMKSLAAPN